VGGPAIILATNENSIFLKLGGSKLQLATSPLLLSHTPWRACAYVPCPPIPASVAHTLRSTSAPAAAPLCRAYASYFVSYGNAKLVGGKSRLLECELHCLPASVGTILSILQAPDPPSYRLEAGVEGICHWE